MNILLNFFPVQSGGGQQVASNFLRVIAKKDFNHKWFVFVGEGSELHRLANEILPREKILAHKYSYLSRITSISIVGNFIGTNKIDIIYNYATVLPIKGLPQVVRSVYSNLYFPEVDFWGSYSKPIRLKKKIIDHFRLKGTLKAEGLIFENQSMLNRAGSLFQYPKENVIYIEPSVSSFDETQENVNYKYLNKIEEFKVLYLSSWHLNKNIHILAEVASNLQDRNVKVKFILSLDSNNRDVSQNLVNEIKKHGVESYFEFIGKVEARYVHQVVKSSNAMILLSKLECFSSNVVEAFYFQKPLIISNEEWARAACLNAAVYVKRSDENDISDKIEELIHHSVLRYNIADLGSERLKDFNTPEDKILKQVKFLEYIHEKSKIIN